MNLKMCNEYSDGLDCEQQDNQWSNEVVYHIYRNDDLETLPVGILEQMANHIQPVIENKTNK